MVHKEAEAELSGPSAEEPQEQVVEFSITIADPALSELVNETHGDRYKELALNLRNQVITDVSYCLAFKGTKRLTAYNMC